MTGLQLGSDWADRILLDGPDDETCLVLGRPVDRWTLRRLVTERQAALIAHGLGPGGAAALRLPPSLAFIANLLAAWRIGAQVTLLDHRLTEHETGRALERILPEVVVGCGELPPSALRTYADVNETVTRYPGKPAATPHALIQLSSGSTGPSKMIGRTAASLAAEVERYGLMDGTPRPGERIVLLASMVHVLGLVGGLLYGLHARAQLVLPERLAVDAVFDAITAKSTPATLLGVPFHLELVASAPEPPKLPQLKRMTTGGELVRPAVNKAFDERYGVPLGNMYGMTEVGVIATDLFGQHRPGVVPAPGIDVRAENGELLVRMPESPYVGLIDPTRWSGGWLHTRDAGSVDPETGVVTIHGRLDSQVSIGGLKVDLSEVEQELAGLPGVAGAVVVFDNAITAYVMPRDPATAPDVKRELAVRLAPYKRPRVWHFVEQLPRTATGKLVRSLQALRETARAERHMEGGSRDEG
jgi:acyl-coenzyme A synthetase/AMP-(fatty) acid ligase